LASLWGRNFILRLIVMAASARLAAIAVILVLAAGSAVAQDADVRAERIERPGNSLFAQLFGRRDQAPVPPGQVPGATPESSELIVRLDRLEAQLRQLTGMVEQLQFRNQQLEGQLRRMQEDTEYRLQSTAPGGRPPVARTPAAPAAVPPVATLPPVASPPPTRRSDVFDPTQSPNAPGAPRPLGSLPAGAVPGGPSVVATAPDLGPPRPPGAPLDLTPPGTVPDATPGPRGPGPISRPVAPGPQATLPPSDSSKDAYDLAYGYVLRRDYTLAETAFRKFLTDFPNDRLAPEAHYWLGESLYVRKQYRDAAESFLKISTDFPNTTKAPDALLRLGQSLAALDERETACAAFGEVARKYPRASAAVKQAVAQEQRRVRC
jgi:tol-pal system protein YbgF